jgi:hypothetical protein
MGPKERKFLEVGTTFQVFDEHLEVFRHKYQMMVLSSMVSSLEQHVSRNSCEDVVENRQLNIDILCSMMEQEITHSCQDYLNDGEDCIASQKLNDHENSSSQKLTAEDRAQIVDWCYGVVDVLQLARSNVAIAMSIADRFMSNPNQLLAHRFTPYLFSPQEIMYDRTMFQLLVVSVLYIAIKINEQVIFSVEQCAEATHGMYTVEDFEGMERAILECLAWKVSAPTALEVGYVVLELVTPQVQDVSDLSIELMGSIVEDLAFQTESAVWDYQLAIQRTSTIAIKALLNAIKYNDELSTTAQQHYLNALLNVFEQCKTATGKPRA